MADKYTAEVAADGTLFQHHGGFPARVVDDEGRVIALISNPEHAHFYARELSRPAPADPLAAMYESDADPAPTSDTSTATGSE